MVLTGAQIRERFISYFRDNHAHLHLPSASLIPDNPTLLLTSAGMVPFVPIFLGQLNPPEPPRVVTCQKVARAGGKDSDIENIGRTARHHSFFEMLGNFSFGDYFKQEVIPWAWEFVTTELGLQPDLISVTVFAGDEQNPPDQEAFEIWHKKVGIPQERIFRMPRKDNFWGPPGPTGPCGPCSELYYDRGSQYGCKINPERCGIGKCDCDRYLEIWNLVFMELFKDEHGNFKPLATKNVDTGAGLERLATILQKKNNSFETDLLFPIMQELCNIAGVEYQDNEQARYLKIITDHVRCVTFLIADGVRTSNVGRGYVLRFIIRRAARFGRLLSLSEPFLYRLVPRVCELYKETYPELAQNEKLTIQLIGNEEERFIKTLDRGMSLLQSLLEDGKEQVSGKEAFNLYATYGVPVELTREIAFEHGKDIDMESFAQAQKEHEEVSAVNKFNVIIAGDNALDSILKEHGPTSFTGYHATEEDAAQVVALVKKGKFIDHIEEGDEAELILNKTPFYAESGGQLGDQGLLNNSESSLAVFDTKKHDALHVHKVKVVTGQLSPYDFVRAAVNKERREATVLHHSTAHLFHAAIRELLGKHVVQAGSQVGPETMRFDFTFERQLSVAELAEVESLMNQWVRLNLPVTTKEMALEDAKKAGAIAMFGEKYGDIVKVVSMGDISLELCGGTHVNSTGTIGSIKIISESSIASGVRRIEALAGAKAWSYVNQHINVLSDVADRLKVRPMDLLAQINKLTDELKQAEKQRQMLEERLIMSKVPDLLADATHIGNIRLVSRVVENISAHGLKNLADYLRKAGDNVVAVLGTKVSDDKISVACGVSDKLIHQGLNAGNIAKEVATICGGSGGGRPELAAAGGKDPAKLKEAFVRLASLIEQGVNSKR